MTVSVFSAKWLWYQVESCEGLGRVQPDSQNSVAPSETGVCVCVYVGVCVCLLLLVCVTALCVCLCITACMCACVFVFRCVCTHYVT